MKDSFESDRFFEKEFAVVEGDPDAFLKSTWDDSLWIESMFAPRVAILQAVSKGRVVGSGIGDTRHRAMMRCLGETAELEAQRRLGAQSRRGVPGAEHDGIAAHRDPDMAKTNAYFEAEERRTVMQWWRGDCGAGRVPEDWLRQHGLLDWIELKRSTAFIRREARLWRLDTPGPVHVIVCRTNYRNGQDPILGFGASSCAFEAVGHAMREALLMEVNLIEVLSARSGYSETDTSAIEAKIAAYSDCSPAYFPEAEAEMPHARTPEVLPEDLPFGTAFKDISFDVTRSVWTCTIEGSVYRQRGPSDPFMNTPH